MKTVALIPARGGSKAIPLKNIRLLAGRPLLYWVCQAAQAARCLDEICVATDSEEIAEVVRSLNLNRVKPVPRAPHTATDVASTESVLLDFVQHHDFDYLVLIQPTSPMLTSQDIEIAVAKVHTGEFDSVLSLVRRHKFIWTETELGAVRPMNYDPANRPRRQDWQGHFEENGALYVVSRKIFEATRCRIGGRIGYIEMGEDSAVDLDSFTDWSIVETLIALREQSR